MQPVALHPQWHAAALRWIANRFNAAATWLEGVPAARGRKRSTDEEYFDSDEYLAEVKHRVLSRYY